MEEATCRLAMKNCDWDHLSAHHLYALMQSFTPMGGALVSVSVHLSEYGKEQLEHERVHGPNIWMREGDAEFLEEQRIREEEDNEAGEEAPEFVQEEASDADVSEEDADAFEDDFVEDNPEIREEVLEGEMFSENKYRRYEIQRLKYYYAIVEFDSAETAAHVFKECEGTEVERSGNVFDLSFVPDDMVCGHLMLVACIFFSSNTREPRHNTTRRTQDFGEPKESANSLAPSYKGQTFVTNALQNGRFAISWDQTDPKRKRVCTQHTHKTPPPHPHHATPHHTTPHHTTPHHTTPHHTTPHHTTPHHTTPHHTTPHHTTPHHTTPHYTTPHQAMTAYSAADDENLDDLDAYLAPAESSDDDSSADPVEKRRAIRRKYSALFEGLGGLAEELPSEGRGGGASDDDDDDDDDDEDASDDGSEEAGSEEAGVHATWSESGGEEGGAAGSDDEALVAAQLAALPSDDEGEEDGGVSGNLEATMHLGAKDGGKTLAETLRIKKERENETVWEKRQRLKKEGRKQAKKERKVEATKPRAQMTAEERRAEKEEQARRTARLTEVMGESAQDFDEDEEGPRRGKFVSKKDKRKEHKARAVEAAQKLRDEKKQKRADALAEKVGAAAPAAAAKQPEEAAKPVSKLMARFGSKLAADPRYNPDVNHPKFQKDEKMQEVVGEIRETRKRKRASADSSKTATGGNASAAAATPDISSTVDYFKAKAAKVKRTN